MFKKSNSDSIWVFVTRDRRFKFDSGWYVTADGLVDFHLVIIQDFFKGEIDPVYIGHADKEAIKKFLCSIVENIIFNAQ